MEGGYASAGLKMNHLHYRTLSGEFLPIGPAASSSPGKSGKEEGFGSSSFNIK